MAAETVEEMLKREQAVDRISRLRAVCASVYQLPISDEELKAWLDTAIAERRSETLKRELSNFDTPELFIMKKVLDPPPKPALVVVPPTPAKEEVVIKNDQQQRRSAKSKPVGTNTH